jgi:hypothetical protein
MEMLGSAGMMGNGGIVGGDADVVVGVRGGGAMLVEADG